MLLKPDEFWTHIERGTIAPFYFFHGENGFLIKDACDQIKTKLLGHGHDEIEELVGLEDGQKRTNSEILVHHTTFVKRVNVKFIQLQHAP